MDRRGATGRGAVSGGDADATSCDAVRGGAACICVAFVCGESSDAVMGGGCGGEAAGRRKGRACSVAVFFLRVWPPLAAETDNLTPCFFVVGPELITFSHIPNPTMATTRTTLRTSAVAGALPPRAPRAAAVAPRVSGVVVGALSHSLSTARVHQHAHCDTQLCVVCVWGTEDSHPAFSLPTHKQAALLRPSLAAPLAAPARAARVGRVGSVTVRANKQIQVSGRERVGEGGRRRTEAKGEARSIEADAFPTREAATWRRRVIPSPHTH